MCRGPTGDLRTQCSIGGVQYTQKDHRTYRRPREDLYKDQRTHRRPAEDLHKKHRTHRRPTEYLHKEHRTHRRPAGPIGDGPTLPRPHLLTARRPWACVSPSPKFLPCIISTSPDCHLYQPHPMPGEPIHKLIHGHGQHGYRSYCHGLTLASNMYINIIHMPLYVSTSQA